MVDKLITGGGIQHKENPKFQAKMRPTWSLTKKHKAGSIYWKKFSNFIAQIAKVKF